MTVKINLQCMQCSVTVTEKIVQYLTECIKCGHCLYLEVEVVFFSPLTVSLRGILKC